MYGLFMAHFAVKSVCENRISIFLIVLLEYFS